MIIPTTTRKKSNNPLANVNFASMMLSLSNIPKKKDYSQLKSLRFPKLKPSTSTFKNFMGSEDYSPFQTVIS